MRRHPGVYRRLARRWLRRRGNLAGPVLTLVTGAAAAQALVFAARPVLTRLYTPEEFGVLTLFVALAALLAAAGTGRYEDALMLPERDEEAVNVLALAVLVALTLGLAVGLATGWVQGPEAVAWRALAPGGVLLAVTSAFEIWHTRLDRFRVVSAGRVAQSATVAAAQLAAGFLAAGAAGLVLGSVAGAAVALTVNATLFARRDLARLRPGLGLGTMRRLARRYARFPSFAAPASLLNVFSSRIPVLVLTALFSLEAVGHFGVAFGTLALPLGMLTGAVGQVFFVRAAEAERAGTLGPLTERIAAQLLGLVLFPALAVVVAGPAAFAFVFGEAWREAGLFARYIALWVALASVASPLTRVFDVRERQRADLGFSIFLFGALAGALLVGGRLGGATGAVVAAGVAGAVARLLHVAWILWLAGSSLGRSAAAALQIGRYALPPLLLLILVQMLGASDLLIVIAMAVCGLVYFGLLARFERSPEASGGGR